MPELDKFNGKHFYFAEEFTCRVKENTIWLEQYGEGEFQLPHIETELKFIQLYEILTGLKFSSDKLIS